jgi:hypothetical protein
VTAAVPPPCRHRRLRVAAATAALVVAATQTLAPVASAARRPPGRIPNAKLDATIYHDQIELVARGQLAAVTAARATAEAATGTLATAVSTEAADQRTADDAGTATADALARVQRAAAGLARATSLHGRANRTDAAALARLRSLAVGLYTGGATIPLSGTGPLKVTEAEEDADDELTLLTGVVGRQLRLDGADVVVARRRVVAARAALAEDRNDLARSSEDAADATGVLDAATTTVAGDRQAVATDDAALTAAVAAESRALADFDGPERPGPHPVPTILGGTALSAPEIVAWFDSSGYVATTRATIGQLASWYVAEGRAEGVRGDVAFAQAVVETGGFSSPDAVGLNNYAGIGHCDSCGSGLRLPSAHSGVRAHIQLLRTWADPTLTTAELAAPPVLASLAPAEQFERGCCQTWNSLTGTWASDPHYATVVLDVYLDMVAFAVAQAQGRGPAPP